MDLNREGPNCPQFPYLCLSLSQHPGCFRCLYLCLMKYTMYMQGMEIDQYMNSGGGERAKP